MYGRNKMYFGGATGSIMAFAGASCPGEAVGTWDQQPSLGPVSGHDPQNSEDPGFQPRFQPLQEKPFPKQPEGNAIKVHTG